MEQEAVFDVPPETQKSEWEASLAIAEPGLEWRPKITPGRIIKKALKVGFLATYLGALNLAYEGLSYWEGDRATLAPAIDGCEAPELSSTTNIDWHPSQATTETLQTIQQQTAGAISAAHEFTPSPQLKDDSGERILLIPSSFPERIANFTLLRSGINIEVYSDKISNLTIYPEQFETAFNEPMEEWYIFSDPSARDFFYCSGQSLLESRDRAGTTYKIFIPSDPELCISGLYLVPADKEDGESNCHTLGATMPNFDYGLLDRFIDPYWMVITPGTADVSEAARIITRVADHEFMHARMSLMRTPAQMDPDERLAQTATRQLAAVRDQPQEPIATYA